MNKVQLEIRVNELVNHVVAGGKIEDDHVEAKREWPKEDKAGQLGGMANKAGGQPILWIVGLCEGSHRVVDLGDTDPASWWQGMRGGFAFDVAPALSHFGFMTQHGWVVALLFETDQAPYLVKLPKVPKDPNNPAVGFRWATNAVPWREGTSVRAATRAELLSILAPAATVPKLDLVRGHADLYERKEATVGGDPTAKVAVNVEMLIDTAPGDHVLFPNHRHSVTVVAPGGQRFDCGEITFRTSAQSVPQQISPPGVRTVFRPQMIKAINEYGATDQPYGLIVRAPDVVMLHAELSFQTTDWLPLLTAPWIDLVVRLPIGSSTRASVLNTRLTSYVKLRAGAPSGMKHTNAWSAAVRENEVRVDTGESEQ
ncbi:hypothetical protein [Nocardia sp. NPDC050717]|uniref:hypothetical protein n=1 Tax=Nocardia sp. NPDC050717 TaxID=3157221 RepID=UPI0033E312D8